MNTEETILPEHLYGGRSFSYWLVLCSMIMTVVILGTAIGITSGYFGGKVDMFLMRFTDIFLALPSMLSDGCTEYDFAVLVYRL